MCELMVRVIDKEPCVDPYDTIKQHKAGDVIAIQADGFAWSATELASPDWRLLKVPGVAVGAFANLLTPEMALEPFGSRRILQRRQCRLNLQALDSNRTFSAQEISEAVYVVEPLRDPYEVLQ